MSPTSNVNIKLANNMKELKKLLENPEIIDFYTARFTDEYLELAPKLSSDLIRIYPDGKVLSINGNVVDERHYFNEKSADNPFSNEGQYLQFKYGSIEKFLIDDVHGHLVDVMHSYALLYHHNQKDKAGTPYFEHVKSVANNVGSHYLSEDIHIAIGYAHDLLEDTDFDEFILRNLSTRLHIAVKILTKQKGQSYDDYKKLVLFALGRNLYK